MNTDLWRKLAGALWTMLFVAAVGCTAGGTSVHVKTPSDTPADGTHANDGTEPDDGTNPDDATDQESERSYYEPGELTACGTALNEWIVEGETEDARYLILRPGVGPYPVPPALLEDGTIVLVEPDGHLSAYDGGTLERRWSVQVYEWDPTHDPYVSQLLATDGVVIVYGSGLGEGQASTLGIDGDTGQILWEKNLAPGWDRSMPRLHLDRQGRIMVGRWDAEGMHGTPYTIDYGVYAIDPHTGELMEEHHGHVVNAPSSPSKMLLSSSHVFFVIYEGSNHIIYGFPYTYNGYAESAYVEGAPYDLIASPQSDTVYVLDLAKGKAWAADEDVPPESFPEENGLPMGIGAGGEAEHYIAVDGEGNLIIWTMATFDASPIGNASGFGRYVLDLTMASPDATTIFTLRFPFMSDGEMWGSFGRVGARYGEALTASLLELLPFCQEETDPLHMNQIGYYLIVVPKAKP